MGSPCHRQEGSPTSARFLQQLGHRMHKTGMQNHNWKMGKSETCRLLCSSLLQSQEESQKVHATFCNSCEVGPGIGQREVTGQWLATGSRCFTAECK